MKILTIPSLPTPAFVHRGYHLAKHLAELGDEVHFLIWDPYPRNISSIKKNLSSSLKYLAYVKDGVMVHKIRSLPFCFPPINGYMFKKFVSQISKREGLDIIISASFINEVIPPFDLPLIYDFWDHHEACMDIYAGNVKRFGVKYILNIKKSVDSQIKHAAAVTAVSDILVDYAKRINSDIPVYKIPNGVDSLFLEATLEKPKNKLGKHSMVYVSHFDKHSNLPKLIEATRLLKRNYPNIKLVLVGNGPLIPGAKELVGSLALTGHVSFLGQVEHKEVVSIVNGCEIGLCSFKKDLYTDSAFPTKIIEYTALGKRIVSSNLEEVKSLDFPNIIFYDESKGVEELANGIITAFNRDIDQRETRKLAYNYTWKGIAQQFRGIVQKVVAQRKG